jgi:hypothetical protein
MLMTRLPGLIDNYTNVSGQSLAGMRDIPSNAINKKRYLVLTARKFCMC